MFHNNPSFINNREDLKTFLEKIRKNYFKHHSINQKG